MGETTRPVIIDLGKTKRKRIRRLKRGTGRLAAEVDAVVADVKESLGGEDPNKEFVPVVIIYQRKRKRGRKTSLPFRLPIC